MSQLIFKKKLVAETSFYTIYIKDLMTELFCAEAKETDSQIRPH